MKYKSKKQSDAAGVVATHAQPDARGLRVGLVVSTYHSEITSALEAGARSAYQHAGGADSDLLVVHAPGAFELPVLAAALLRRPDVAAVVVLGCVVQGQTRHDRYICTAVTDQCSRLAVETGKPLGYWQARREGGIADQLALHPALLLPPREEIYRRCDVRFARMLDNGAVKEVEALLARKLDPALPVMRAIGVAEIAALLRGAISRGDALARGAQATRNYAKRQYTWARHQFPDDWNRFESHDFATSIYFERLLPI